MKRKALSVLLCVAMLLSMSSNVFVAFAWSAEEDAPTIVVSEATGVAGDEVEVTISLKNNPGIAAMRLMVEYDSALTLLSITDCGNYGDHEFTQDMSKNPVALVYNSATEENMTNDGDIATLKFKINKGTLAGEYPISVYAEEGDAYDVDLNDVALSGTGYVKVEQLTAAASTVEGVKGDEVTVDIDLKNNRGLAALRLFVDYDTDALELTAINNTELLAGQFEATNNLAKSPVALLWNIGAGTDEMTENGTIATLTFTIKEAIAFGEYPIALSAEADDIYDVELTNVAMLLTNGAVKVVPENADVAVDSTTAKRGDEISINIAVNDNPGLAAARLLVNFDTDVLEFLGATDGGLFTDFEATNTSKSPIALVFQDVTETGTAANGIMATLNFRVLDDAAFGYSPIEVTYDTEDVYDVNLEQVDLTIGEAGVLVEHDEADITVGTAIGAEDDEIEIPITIENNEGLTAMRLFVNYDAAALKLLEIVDGELFGEFVATEDLNKDTIALVFQNIAEENMTANGTVATLKFRILEGAALGDSPITVTYEEDDVYDIGFAPVDLNITDGYITIEDRKAEVSIDKQIKVKRGDEIEVPVMLDVNPGLAAMRLFLDFDTNVLEFLGAEGGSIFANFEVTNTSKSPIALVFNDASEANVTGTGVLATLKFRAAADATVDEYALSLSYNAEDVYNVDFKDVKVAMTDGSILVVPQRATVEVIADDVKQGNEFEVKVDLSTNPGLAAMRLFMEFDTTAFEFLGAENGDIFANFEVTNTSKSPVALVFNGAAEDNVTATGTAATLKFRALDDAALAEYAFTLNYLEEDVYDINLNEVWLDLVDAEIAVEENFIEISIPGSVICAPTQTIEVPVTLANNVGIAAMRLFVDFDTELLTFIGAEDGGLLGELTVTDESKSPIALVFNSATEANYTENGVIATLTFEVTSDTSKLGTVTPITLTYNEDDIYDIELDSISATITNGEVTIDCEHGTTEWVETKPASCTEVGSETLTCTVCGHEFETREIPMKDHTPKAEWEVTKPASCTEVGEEVLKCDECGELLDTREIPMLEHTPKAEWEVTKPASCTEVGEEVLKCDECGEVLDTREIPMLEHTYGDWYETKPATRTEEGVERRDCTAECGTFETRPIARLLLPGDVDMSNEVDNRDITLYLRLMAGWELDAFDYDVADVNADGEFDNRDITALLRYMAGWDVELLPNAPQNG